MSVKPWDMSDKKHISGRSVWAIFTIAIFLVAFLGSVTKTLASEGRIAFGLNGISDWSTQHPFLDVMKSARPWIGHLPNQWGGADFEDLHAEGVFDEQGWPIRIPDGVTKLESLILTDQPPEARHLNGRYILEYEGEGNLNVTGRARVISREPGLRVFSYSPGSGSVGIAISATNPDNPIRNIRVVPEKYLQDHKAGRIFNPAWIKQVQSADVIRFMDWMFTNGSQISRWADMPESEDFTYGWRGVPVSVMVELANTLDADPWFTIPHLADDDLVRKFAETVKSGLDPHLVAHIEYSNEVWNFLFEQAHWAARQAEALWGETSDGWMQYYGYRSASVMKIWFEVYGSEAPTRVKRVVAVHTGWPELEQAILTGDKAKDALGHSPLEVFDAYAVTGYFGSELGESETLEMSLNSSAAQAEQDGRAQGLSRVALREFVEANRFEGMAAVAAEIVRNGSLRELTEDLWPYHASVAKAHDLELIMYEGGTHAAAFGDAVQDDRLVSFLMEFNYSNEMAELYKLALTAWHRLTDSPFNAFVDVAGPSQWGSWGALRHLNDDNPRWQALTGSSSGGAEN